MLGILPPPGECRGVSPTWKERRNSRVASEWTCDNLICAMSNFTLKLTRDELAESGIEVGVM